MPTFQKKCLKKYFSLFLVPYLVECYFDMSHGSYDSNLGSKRLILARDVRSRSWPNIDGTYGKSNPLNKGFSIVKICNGLVIFAMIF